MVVSTPRLVLVEGLLRPGEDLAQKPQFCRACGDTDVRFSIYAQNGAERIGRRRNLTSFSTRRHLLNVRLQPPHGRGHGDLGDLKVDPLRSTAISAFVDRGYLKSLKGGYPRCGTRGGEGGEGGEWYVRDAPWGGGGFGDHKVDPFRSSVISAFVKRGYLNSLKGGLSPLRKQGR